MADGLEALPCPMCGVAMSSTRDRLGFAFTHSHPVTGHCLFDRLVVGGHNTHVWNTKGRLAYDVVDGAPVFNTEGRGVLCTANMVNQSIAYLILTSRDVPSRTLAGAPPCADDGHETKS